MYTLGIFIVIFRLINGLERSYPLVSLNEYHELFDRSRLLDIEPHSKVFSLNKIEDLKLYRANTWNKIMGYHCPPGSHQISLKHTFWTELYTCVKVPNPLISTFESFKLNMNVSSMSLSCKGVDHTVTVGFCDPDRFRLLIDSQGNTFYTTTYCLSHYYQMYNNGTELYNLKYITDDNTVTFDIPPQECSIFRYDDGFEQRLPLSVCIDGDYTMHSCLSEMISSNQCNNEMRPPYNVVPFAPATLMSFKIGGKCATVFKSEVNRKTVTIHIGSAISNSLVDLITRGVMSLIMPIIDFLIDSLLYIFDGLLKVFESTEFLSILHRVYELVIVILKSVFTFIIDHLVPKIISAFYESSPRFKLLVFTFLFIYIKYAKFWYAILVCAICSLFFINK
ncbi:hypothetical protein 2 [Agua Salud negevirus]|nr:hypothetical protein 2 [Agua Salud negevirus]